jgi:hypothetical protein
MAIRLIELPPQRVGFDDARFPDRDDSWVFEHLRDYLSLLESLPAISLHVDEEGPVVTRGHNYLRIARELGRARIRGVIQASSEAGAVAELLSQPDVQALDWEAIDAAEQATPVVDQWHVFFFERPLNRDEKARFEREIAGFFTGLDEPSSAPREGTSVADVQHDDQARCARFLVRTPVGDESWYGRYLAAVKRFSAEAARVVSYQGRRFEA